MSKEHDNLNIGQHDNLTVGHVVETPVEYSQSGGWPEPHAMVWDKTTKKMIKIGFDGEEIK